MAQGSNRHPAKPTTPEGRRLSAKHLAENIRYNEQHAAEHKTQAASDRRKLAAVKKQIKGGRKK